MIEKDNNSIKRAKKLEQRIIRARLKATGSDMWNFAKMIRMIKKERLYKSLGFDSFVNWHLDWGLPVPTVNTWLNLHNTYIIRHGFKVSELHQVEVRILKNLLPVARSNGATKEKLKKLIDKVIQMEFDYFLDLLPEIKRSFSL